MSTARHLAALVLVLALFAAAAPAKFAFPEIEKVPVDRLLMNLEEAVKKDTKDAKAMINLARVHAMAYSLKSEEIPVSKKAPDAPWFGFTPPIVPFNKVQSTDDAEKLKAAKGHLDAALKLYEGAVKIAPDDLKAKLGLAWLLSQTDKKADAVAALRKIVEEGWKADKDLTRLGLGGHTITAEAAGYLIPLLDKEKNEDEIATLTERIAKLKKLPRPVTPIAVPLRDDLRAADLEDRGASVAFDADGTGLAKKWTWITRDAAWLVHDPKATGKVTSALQLFGNVTFWLFWDTGYDALAALDDNGDGELSGAELAGLALWRDADGDGVSDPGEVRPLSEYGIVSLSCKSARDATHPDRVAWSKAGVKFKDGKTRPTFDLVLHPAK